MPHAEHVRSSITPTLLEASTMSDRITHSRVELRTQAVNGQLRSGLYVRAERRNGYTGLDLYDADGCIRTLNTGTTSEVYRFLGGMLAALEIVGRA